VITDAHANLPALDAALDAIDALGCDAIYHTGDAIGIGPYPTECLDHLLHTLHMRLVMGNHDAWFAHGLPHPRPPWMSEGEVTHQRWVHDQLDPSLRRVVGEWPYAIHDAFAGVRVTFTHYGRDASGRGFVPIVPEPRSRDLDTIFEQDQADLICYGHHHPASDLTGRARYVNPGALGCSPTATARFLTVAFADGAYVLERHAVPYDPTDLVRQFEERDVPARAFIRAAFFG
jgi:predicted phosphodiesterase